MMAQALSSSFGRDNLPDPLVENLCTGAQLDRAREWGLAIRLGQRLCGGVGSILKQTRLSLKAGELRLHVATSEAALVNDGVLRRLSRLATALDRQPEVIEE